MVLIVLFLGVPMLICFYMAIMTIKENKKEKEERLKAVNQEIKENAEMCNIISNLGVGDKLNIVQVCLEQIEIKLNNYSKEEILIIEKLCERNNYIHAFSKDNKKHYGLARLGDNIILSEEWYFFDKLFEIVSLKQRAEKLDPSRIEYEFESFYKDYDKWKKYNNYLEIPKPKIMSINQLVYYELVDNSWTTTKTSSKLGTAVTESIWGTAAAIQSKNSYTFKHIDAAIYFDYNVNQEVLWVRDDKEVSKLHAMIPEKRKG